MAPLASLITPRLDDFRRQRSPCSRDASLPPWRIPRSAYHYVHSAIRKHQSSRRVHLASLAATSRCRRRADRLQRPVRLGFTRPSMPRSTRRHRRWTPRPAICVIISAPRFKQILTSHNTAHHKSPAQKDEMPSTRRSPSSLTRLTLIRGLAPRVTPSSRVRRRRCNSAPRCDVNQARQRVALPGALFRCGRSSSGPWRVPRTRNQISTVISALNTATI
ncbi:hypothetical protein F5X68DRAFT_59829 [Plectosphaerella plurivora]|uniref:Uncharacterized protein n=1 Tax=Plectosphaerella plurivora TaxID=936078 RepID=A0A9P9AEC5_9PEZI|nr:hypothetical protein F5X68DRAFT_59829 [Plectosphaerella plurivora]